MRPTLTQVAAASLAALTLALGGLFAAVSVFSQTTILDNAERSRAQTAHEVEMRVSDFLAQAPGTVRAFQDLVKSGAVDLHDAPVVEHALVTLLLATADVAELSFTVAEGENFDTEGARILAENGRGQWSVERPGGAENAAVESRHVFAEGGEFVSERRRFGGQPSPAAMERRNGLGDPTQHLTFTTPASREFAGQLLWTELTWAQLDSAVPEAQRRVEVSVQQTITDAGGRFAGVIRVGLFAQQLDAAMRRADAADPHRVFLRDADGHLLTRLAPGDPVREIEGSLYIVPAGVPAEVQAALDQPLENAGGAMQSRTLPVAGQTFLTTLLPLRGTQGWWVGVVVPRSYYLGRLVAMRDRLLIGFLATVAAVIAAGALVLRELRRAHGRLARETARMNRFEFTPTAGTSAFADVGEVLEGMERAKAALHALSKYAPVDLVRRLFREKLEPKLGGEPHEITVMFTDIRGFTTLAEQAPPATLARALGLYLDAMVRIIQQECGGTIDKFIGDAIMALWNVPAPAADHARLACRAAWRCRAAVQEVAGSPGWPGGLPPFETRFGLHLGTALVGHFGATERMNYTAVGDVVNVAARFEKLNKEHGTSIIVSADIVAQAAVEFDFRLLGRVAVRGKTEALEIYELLGPKAPPAFSASL